MLSDAVRRATTRVWCKRCMDIFVLVCWRKLLNSVGGLTSHGELRAYEDRCCSPGRHFVRLMDMFLCSKSVLMFLFQLQNLEMRNWKKMKRRIPTSGRETAIASCGRHRVHGPLSMYVCNLNDSPVTLLTRLRFLAVFTRKRTHPLCCTRTLAPNLNHTKISLSDVGGPSMGSN